MAQSQRNCSLNFRSSDDQVCILKYAVRILSASGLSLYNGYGNVTSKFRELGQA